MTKKELLDAVMDAEAVKKSGVKKLEAQMILDTFYQITAAELLGDGEITMYGVGKLKIRKTAPRMGRNPRTGESIKIPAGKKIVFVPFRDLKDALRG